MLQVLFVSILMLFGGVLCAAETLVTSEVLDEVSKNFARTKNDSQEIEDLSFEFTEKLCYAYKFRQKHGITLDPSVFNFATDYYLVKHWRQDTDLQDAEIAWDILAWHALQAAYMYNRESGFFLVRSKFSTTLERAAGYRAAVVACSLQLGTDISATLAKDIKKTEYAVSALANLIGFGLVTKGLRLVTKISLVQKAISPFAKRATVRLGAV